MNKKSIILILILISIISIGFKLYFIDFSIPVHSDDLTYALRAMAHSEGDFSQSPRKGSGWPLFASIFFSGINSQNFLDYSNALRLMSIGISTMTILPMYGLTRKFFNEKYSIVGASLFAFEPHLNYNASYGFSEPLYIFLIVLTLFFILSKNYKYAFVSFAISGLVFWTRIEGFMIFFAISIIYFINFRKTSNFIPKYFISLLIFFLVISPIFVIRAEQYGDPFYFYFSEHIFVDDQSDYGVSTATADNYVQEKGFSEFIYRFIIHGILQTSQLIFAISFPYLIVLLPFGLFFSIRAYDHNNDLIKSNWVFIVSTLAIMIIPIAVISDRRFLFYLFPSLIIFSIIPIQRLIEYGLTTFSFTKRQKNYFLSGILILIIILSSFFIMRYDRVNVEYEYELINFAEFLVKDIDNKVIFDRTKLDQYVLFVQLNENPDKFKNYKISHDKKPYGTNFPYDIWNKLIQINGSSINEVIQNGKSLDGEFLIIFEQNNNFEFLDDVYYNEKNYPNLKKVFDSKEDNYQYLSFKVFKILN